MDLDFTTTKGKIFHTAGNLGGKEVVAIAGASSSTVGAASGAAGGVFAAFDGVLSVAALSVAAAVGAVVSQMTYHSKRAYLREMYKHEVGATLGKSPEKVTDKDVDLVAKGDPERGIAANHTIAEGIEKLKNGRNVGILVSAVSILATVFLLSTAFQGAAIISGAGALATAGNLAAKGLIGFSVHHLLEQPISFVGRKLFGIEKVTTHERVATLEKEHKNGKSIAKEQVLGVFISANKELEKFVKDHYGKQYDKLGVKDKKLLVDTFEQYIPVTQITDSINSGAVRVSELAFSAEGKKSGVAPNSVKTELSLIGKARGALHSVGQKISQKIKSAQESGVKAAAGEANVLSVAHASQSSQSGIAPKRAVVEYDNPVPKRSFVERYQAEKQPSINQGYSL